MAKSPILVYLHGVGDGDLDDGWLGALNAGLAAVGYPSVRATSVVAPKYPNTLRFPLDDKVDRPKVLIEDAPRNERARLRRELERRTAALEIRLRRHDEGEKWPVANVIADVTLKPRIPGVVAQQARNYVTEEQGRNRVLSRVLAKLPTRGSIVIIGHSLGSVITADILRRLPPAVRVEGIVTIGSPLGSPALRPKDVISLLDRLPGNLGWWVNFWNPWDIVATGGGVANAIPWILDQRTVATRNPAAAHNAATYLAEPAVAEAVGFALFGSRSKQLARQEAAVELSPNFAETQVLIALLYGHLMCDRLEGEQQERFRAALRDVQGVAIERLRDHRRQAGMPTPTAVALAGVDLTDADSCAVRPEPIQTLDSESAVLPLVSISSTNLVQPFEISISKKVRAEAMVELTLQLGLRSDLGSDVFAASEQAKAALRDAKSWRSWALVAVGAAAVVAATGGLALAAAPGVAGAAAVTSALAAFGPGGMIGGLLSAGALAATAGGSVTAGLVGLDTSAATVEAVLVAQLTAALVRKKQGLDQDGQTWRGFVELRSELRRQLARLGAYSDEDAPSLNELKLKLRTVEKALSCMADHGLNPDEDDIARHVADAPDFRS